MLELADKYPAAEKEKYKAAAQKFRLPYWDYFRPRGGPVRFPGIVDGGSTTFRYNFNLPRIMWEDELTVKRWDSDKPVRFPNPFRFFKFPSKGGIPGDNWSILDRNVSLNLIILTKAHVRRLTCRDSSVRILRPDKAEINRW